ncbi:MAG: enoyl-CoA hydratase/isomerase family protein, partial [Chloroflexi bacterium]|nr:enoyl-CoA hydratase/isomerase family protein [Chloroflexota bacterium]
NALNRQTREELLRAIDELAAEDAIRAIIITGAGEKAFVSGADIGELQALETAQDGFERSRSSHQVLDKMEALPKPIIMAVNGYALGGGCELAMAGDIILASENAQFGQPEVALGIIPGFGGTQRLPRLIGRTRALELIVTGRRIRADEAYQMGLVNRVVPPDQLLPIAEEMARAIARQGPVAVALAKRAVYEGLELSPRQGNELESEYFGQAVGTADRKEGTTAFLEKRAPRWQGQ